MNTQLKLFAIAVTMITAIGNSSAMAGEGQPAPKPNLVCIEDGAAIPVSDEKDCKRGKIRRVGAHQGGAFVSACEGKPAGTTVKMDGGRIAVCRGN